MAVATRYLGLLSALACRVHKTSQLCEISVEISVEISADILGEIAYEIYIEIVICRKTGLHIPDNTCPTTPPHSNICTNK